MPIRVKQQNDQQVYILCPRSGCNSEPIVIYDVDIRWTENGQRIILHCRCPQGHQSTIQLVPVPGRLRIDQTL